MPDARLPKAVIYSPLSSGSRVCGRSVKRYKDSLKKSIQLCNIDPATWEITAQDRWLLRHCCETGISSFERQRISDLQLKRERRKAGVDVTSSQSHNCTICGRGCAAAIGLYSHMRAHKHWLLIRQLDGRFQQHEGKGRYSSSWELHLRATGRHLPCIWDHTVLPATRHKWTRPA